MRPRSTNSSIHVKLSSMSASNWNPPPASMVAHRGGCCGASTGRRSPWRGAGGSRGASPPRMRSRAGRPERAGPQVRPDVRRFPPRTGRGAARRSCAWRVSRRRRIFAEPVTAPLGRWRCGSVATVSSWQVFCELLRTGLTSAVPWPGSGTHDPWHHLAGPTAHSGSGRDGRAPTVWSVGACGLELRDVVRHSEECVSATLVHSWQEWWQGRTSRPRPLTISSLRCFHGAAPVEDLVLTPQRWVYAHLPPNQELDKAVSR